MRISRDSGRAPKRWPSRGQGPQIYEFLNLGIWAVAFIAAGIILDRPSFNAIAPFLAFGMVLSTMIVRWARMK
jgi:hypothetical protein